MTYNKTHRRGVSEKPEALTSSEACRGWRHRLKAVWLNNNIKVSPSHEILEELKTAVFNCDIEAVEAALKKGAKPNLPYNHQGRTPFLRACRAFYEPEVIKLFLNYGANFKKNLFLITY